MGIGKVLVIVIWWLAFACNVMLALFLFGRVLYDLVGRLRTRVGRLARLKSPDGRSNVISEPWTERIVGVGRDVRPRARARGKARPPRENAEAQVAGETQGA